MAYRLTNGLWVLLFAYATAVQLNDPDPVRWVGLYGTSLAFCLVAAILGHVPIRPTVAWGICCAGLAGANALFGAGQSEPMGRGLLRDEITREVLGLLLSAGWMFALAGWTRFRRTDEAGA